MLDSDDGLKPERRPERTPTPHDPDDGAPPRLENRDATNQTTGGLTQRGQADITDPGAAPPQLDGIDVDDEIAPVPRFISLTEPTSSETAPKRGRWEVITEASRYHLDLDRELLRRIRGTVKPANTEVGFPTKLRDHDRGWVRLLRIVRLEVGRPAVFDIESLGGPDVAYTRRTTTWVVWIRQLGDDEPFG